MLFSCEDYRQVKEFDTFVLALCVCCIPSLIGLLLFVGLLSLWLCAMGLDSVSRPLFSLLPLLLLLLLGLVVLLLLLLLFLS